MAENNDSTPKGSGPRQHVKEFLISLLQKKDFLTPEDVLKIEEDLRQPQKWGPNSFLELLIENYRAPDVLIRDALAEYYNLPVVSMEDVQANEAASKQIGYSICRKFALIPFKVDPKYVHLAVFNPTNIEAEDNIRAITKRIPVNHIASRSEILEAISQTFRSSSILESYLDKLGVDRHELEKNLQNSHDLDDSAFKSSSPLVRLVQKILVDGADASASDIHFEENEYSQVVRYRIDGDLSQVLVLPKRFAAATVSRIKVLAQMDIAEKRLAQDGQMRIALGKSEYIDARVSSMPTAYGEKVVLRLLDSKMPQTPLQQLGFSDENMVRYKAALDLTYGVVIVTGPTGSGKSTTLYSTLNDINEERLNIVTIEDPIEYRLPGINQVQVNYKKGLTFAHVLRSVLRQDPDVILVGEIRDLETAKIAAQAAQTGHLVLSTLHTNDAPSATIRLLNLGLDSHSLASSLRAVIAQRLIKKICPKCIHDVTPSQRDRELLAALWRQDVQMVQEGAGCAFCRQTGYRGREAIQEVMLMTPELAEIINSTPSPTRITDQAMNDGMIPMVDEAYRKALGGLTTLSEAFRVVGPPRASTQMDPYSRDGGQSPTAPQSQKDWLMSSQGNMGPPINNAGDYIDGVGYPADGPPMQSQDSIELADAYSDPQNLVFPVYEDNPADRNPTGDFYSSPFNDSNSVELVDDEILDFDSLDEPVVPFDDLLHDDDDSDPFDAKTGLPGTGEEELMPLDNRFLMEPSNDQAANPVFDAAWVEKRMKTKILSGAEPAPITAEIPDRPRRILICDDDRFVLKAAEHALKNAGNFEVATVENGEIAISSILEFKPDLVVLDLVLPGLSGFHILKQLRSLPNGQNLSVMILTAEQDPSDEMLGYYIGTNDYVKKPIEMEEFVVRVKTLLGMT